MPSHPRIGILGSLIKGLPDLWPRLNDEPAFGHFFDLTKNNLVISITNLMPGTLEALCFMLYAVKIFTQNNKIFQYGRRPPSNLANPVPAFRFPPPAYRLPPPAFRLPLPEARLQLQFRIVRTKVFQHHDGIRFGFICDRYTRSGSSFCYE